MTNPRGQYASRRDFIGGSLAAGALLSLPSGVRAAVGPRTQATVAPAGDLAAQTGVVVHLFLRGGFDALSAIFPLGDADLRAARPVIAVPDAAALNLGNGWGLHPALAPLVPYWNAGELAIVVGVGATTHTRSHFDETNAVTRASFGGSTLSRTGWIARATDELTERASLQSVSIASSTLASRNGTKPSLSVGRLSNTRFPSVTGLSSVTFADFVREVGRSSGSSWAARATATTDAVRLVEGLRTVEPAVTYPTTDTAARLRDAAALIKGDAGVRFVDLDFAGDWDLHAGIGTVDAGTMRGLLTDLAVSLAIFRADLGAHWSRVTVVTSTEFGRRVRENASQGADHGWASAMFVLGGAVKGGRVLGAFPGLAPSQLADGDVRVTTDYRSVLAEVLTRGAGLPGASIGRVFPRFSPVSVDAMR
jgi:uncharacterized protein (DUF1501 family)